MGSKMRAELSEKNKYWVEKHRYYELKHFCLQYQSWKKAYAAITELSSPILDVVYSKNNIPGDPTSKYAAAKAYYAERIKLIERIAMEADKDLYYYILRAVTEELSYNYLKSRLEIPCGKDMYYDRYRKFFWLLSKER